MQYIRISEKDFFFAQYDSRNASSFEHSHFRLQPHKSAAATFREALAAAPFMQRGKETTEVLVAGANVLVPLSEFMEEDSQTLYEYCSPRAEKCRVFYDTVPSANVVMLFSLPETLCHILEDELPNVRYTSSAMAVARHFSSKSKTADGSRRVYVYVCGDTAEVSVYEDARVVVTNSYKVSAPSDVLYYLFSLARQQSIDLSATPVYVAAETGHRDRLVEELRRYTPNAYAVNPAAEFNRNIVATTEGLPYDLVCRLLAR